MRNVNEKNARHYVTPYTEDVTIISPKKDGMPFYCQMCGISYCDDKYCVVRKKSGISCIEYIVSGTGTVKTKGETFYPVAGDVYVLEAGEDHFYYSDSENPWVKIWFNIEGPVVDKLISIYNPSGKTVFKDADVKHIFEKFIETANTKSEAPEKIHEKCSLVFHELLISLTTRDEKSEAGKIREYIDGHVNENISVEELANLIFRSPSQTIRIFKKAYGITPHRYMLEQKIKTAKLLLRNTNMLVKEIALKLNFADEHYFSVMFKKIAGKTPLEYKRRANS